MAAPSGSLAISFSGGKKKKLPHSLDDPENLDVSVNYIQTFFRTCTSPSLILNQEEVCHQHLQKFVLSKQIPFYVMAIQIKLCHNKMI